MVLHREGTLSCALFAGECAAEQFERTESADDAFVDFGTAFSFSIKSFKSRVTLSYVNQSNTVDTLLSGEQSVTYVIEMVRKEEQVGLLPGYLVGLHKLVRNRICCAYKRNEEHDECASSGLHIPKARLLSPFMCFSIPLDISSTMLSVRG